MGDVFLQGYPFSICTRAASRQAQKFRLNVRLKKTERKIRAQLRKGTADPEGCRDRLPAAAFALCAWRADASA
jgi:hypothetical protein